MSLDAALFVSEAVHEREIVLADGTKARLWFREISSEHFQAIRTPSNDPKVQHAALSKAIAASLCDADGASVLDEKKAGKLKDGVRLAIAFAISEVNGMGAHVGKVSPPEANDGSGTSSSSQASEAEPSEKQNDG